MASWALEPFACTLLAQSGPDGQTNCNSFAVKQARSIAHSPRQSLVLAASRSYISSPGPELSATMHPHKGRSGHVAAAYVLFLALSTCRLSDGFVVPPPGSRSSPSAACSSSVCPDVPCNIGLDYRSRQLRHGPFSSLRLASAASDAPSLASTSASPSSTSTWSYDAVQLEETETEAVLDDGSTLLYLVRSLISPDGDEEEDAADQLPICQGVLVRPRPSNDPDAKNHPTGNMEAWITSLSEAPADGEIAKEQANIFEMAVAKVVDSLLLQRLLLERSGESADGIDAMADLILGVDVGSDADDALSSLFQKAMLSRGLVSVTSDDNEKGESRMMFRIDYGRLVRSYSELAIEYRGTTLGIEALEILGLMSSRRVPYRFPDETDYSSREAIARGDLSTRTVVAPQSGLLPMEIIDQIKDIMATIEGNGWLSTNLDSVDNLPSLHLNLISGGEPIFPTMNEDSNADDDNGNNAPMTFENSIGKLWRLVKPYLEDALLPNVRQVMGSSKVDISDVFIRRYGEDVQPDHSAATRYGISAHFDVTASTTSVVALDDVAAEGKSGLYTTENSEVCTNHAALRRYFPLGAGDAVVHTWDVLHGVEIDPGQQRTSLIVWFEDRGKDRDQSPTFPPWLSNPSRDDDIGQFVLATASFGSVDESMLSTEYDGSDDDCHPHNLYIRSAALGNAFALASLGSLCNESALSSEFVAKTRTMLRKLRGNGDDETYKRAVGTDAEAKALAIELWHEAAIRGNPLAQTSLADEYMGQSMEAMRAGGDGNNDRSHELRLKAATLFALAAQQGYDDALQALPRLLNIESSTHENAEDFYSSPVFQVAQAVLA